MGLGHREMQSLDGLFSRCCEVQDQYQERVLVQEESNPQLFTAFREALVALSAEIERVKKALPAFASFYTAQCANIVRTIDSGISESEEAVKRQLLALQEAAYMQKLRSRFQLVEIPADGSCLFAAVGKGMLGRPEQHHQEGEKHHESPPPPLSTAQVPPASPGSSPPPPPAQTPPTLLHSSPISDGSDVVMREDASAAEKEEAPPRSPSPGAAAPMSDTPSAPSVMSDPPPSLPSNPPPPVKSPQELSRAYRSECVHHLLSDAHFHAAIRREVREAVVQEREGHGDPTSALIHQLLSQRYNASQEAIDAALDSTDDDGILQVYAAAMEKEGIYGTQLEVEALSSALHVPIHIYYRAGSEDDENGDGGGKEGQPGEGELKPTQIVGGEQEGSPISLAFYMANRHYNLLLPRPPPPPPPPQPTPPPALPTSVPVHTQSKGSEMLDDSIGSHPADDELMVALLEAGTPSPLPPEVTVNGGDGTTGNGLDPVGLKRSRSGVPLSMDRHSAGSDVANGTGDRLHRRGESKDELHLLTAAPTDPSKSQAAPSHSKVRSIVSSWEAGAPSALLKLNPQQPQQPPTQQEDSQQAPPQPPPADVSISSGSHQNDSHDGGQVAEGVSLHFCHHRPDPFRCFSHSTVRPRPYGPQHHSHRQGALTRESLASGRTESAADEQHRPRRCRLPARAEWSCLTVGLVDGNAIAWHAAWDGRGKGRGGGGCRGNREG